MSSHEKQGMNHEATPLEQFKREMRLLKEREMEKKQEWLDRGKEGAAYNPHFDAIDPEFLNDQDQFAYESLEFLSVDEFENLKRARQQELKNKDLPEVSAVDDFWAYLGNRYMGIVGEQRKYQKKHLGKNPSEL